MAVLVPFFQKYTKYRPKLCSMSKPFTHKCVFESLCQTLSGTNEALDLPGHKSVFLLYNKQH